MTEQTAERIRRKPGPKPSGPHALENRERQRRFRERRAKAYIAMHAALIRIRSEARSLEEAQQTASDALGWHVAEEEGSGA